MKKSTIATISIASFLAGALFMTSVSDVLANTLERVNAYINKEIRINVNGQEAKLTNPVITYNNSTYVSVREIGGLVGSDIKWDGANKRVEIKTGEAEESKLTTTTKYLKFGEIGESNGLTVDIEKIEYTDLPKGFRVYFSVENNSSKTLTSSGGFRFKLKETMFEDELHHRGVALREMSASGFIYNSEASEGFYFWNFERDIEILEIQYFPVINRSWSTEPLFIWKL